MPTEFVPPKKQILGIAVVAAVVFIVVAGTGILNKPTALVASLAAKVKGMFAPAK
jgi:hypothetical protein